MWRLHGKQRSGARFAASTCDERIIRRNLVGRRFRIVVRVHIDPQHFSPQLTDEPTACHSIEGKSPAAFDVLYWNADTTRMAAALHRDMVTMGVHNSLATPGAVSMLGTPVDLNQLTTDAYVVAGVAGTRYLIVKAKVTPESVVPIHWI